MSQTYSGRKIALAVAVLVIVVVVVILVLFLNGPRVDQLMPKN